MSPVPPTPLFQRCAGYGTNTGHTAPLQTPTLPETRKLEEHWAWNGATFELRPHPQGPDAQGGMSLQFSGGKLEGTNHGEFGGTLTWKCLDRNTKSEVIFRDDAVGMANDGDGTMVLFGLSHMGLAYGHVLRVTRTSDNDWGLSEAARLPAEGEALTTVAPRTFAALSRNRVVVFTRTCILGMAACGAPRRIGCFAAPHVK